MYSVPDQSANTLSMSARTLFQDSPPLPAPIRGMAMVVTPAASACVRMLVKAASTAS
jgi:hypothetical protein